MGGLSVPGMRMERRIVTSSNGLREERLANARELLAEIDKRTKGAALYVSPDENPIHALRKIHAYLVGLSSDGAVALAAVNLERVIVRLAEFRMETRFTK
jgi:hypothetical protein